MPWSDDLSDLLQPPPPDAPFRQGYMLSFDPLTGANVVLVGGGQMTDLPLLNIGDTVNLVGEVQAGAGLGSSVIIMKMGNSWCIMGRISAAGTGQFSQTTIALDLGGQIGSGLAITTVETELVTSETFTIPLWANRVDVIAFGRISAVNSNAAPGTLIFRARAGSLLSAQYYNQTTAAVANARSHVTAQAQAFQAGAIGGATFNCGVLASVNPTTWAANAENRYEVNVQAFYRRTP